MSDYLSTRDEFEDLAAINDQELVQRHVDALAAYNFAKENSDVVDEILIKLLEQDERCFRAEIERRRGDTIQKGRAPNGHWPELSPLSLSTVDRTEWVVDKMLPQGTASLLVAKPKVGKSCLAVQASLAVARGIPFL